ncbi:hypothetical protein ACQ86N_16090 [Puia sp. P3]|uniref:hypothetical protein n=1 Tax=Puia sp. P3 TaxID=3423952 RepID=UPI003D67A536
MLFQAVKIRKSYNHARTGCDPFAVFEVFYFYTNPLAVKSVHDVDTFRGKAHPRD